MDMYCTQQSQKWVRKCKEWGAGWCRLREALCMRWSWWCWLQSVTLKTATLSLFLLWFIFQYQLADTPARLVFRVLLRLQCWCLVQDVLEVRPAKSVESQLLWFRADGPYSTCGNRPVLGSFMWKDPIQRGSMATSPDMEFQPWYLTPILLLSCFGSDVSMH